MAITDCTVQVMQGFFLQQDGTNHVLYMSMIRALLSYIYNLVLYDRERPVTVGGQDSQDPMYLDSSHQPSQLTVFTTPYGKQSIKSFHSEPSRYLRVGGISQRASGSSNSFQAYQNNKRLTVRK